MVKVMEVFVPIMNEKFFDLKKEKQDRMINAALKVFAQNGFKRASTDEMVKEAGISKGLLFHYFGSKNSLYAFIYDYSIRYLILELSSTVDTNETDFFTQRIQIERAGATAMGNFPFMCMFIRSSLKETDPAALEIIAESGGVYRDTMEEIESRIDYSNINGIAKVRLRSLVDFYSDGMLTAMLRADGFDPEEYFKDIQGLLEDLRALCV